MAAGIVDVNFDGYALLSHGFLTVPDEAATSQVYDLALSGIALLTFGFIVPVSDIWIPCDDPVTTTWTVCP